MKRRLFPLCLGLLTVVLMSAVPATVRSASFQVLQPGRIVQHQQEIPVNIVLIGYDKRDNGRKDVVVDKAALLKELPASYTPVVRYPQFYGVEGRDLGLKYTFKYKVVETNDSWENAFFSWLGRQGIVGTPTLYQRCYSGTAPNLPSGQPDPCNQTKNRREITRTRFIDAPTVEKYLTQNARSLLGTTADRAYTIYYINWYSRTDFQDHVYTKTDDPEPDFGINVGRTLASRKMIGWGGTSSRSWFFDLSAGPEATIDNYVVDTKDLDGDGLEDYRMPPIWEYAAGGYRAPSAISRDLGLVARYVAINLLFTSSPLYDPLVTAPGLGGDKVVHLETFQDDPANAVLVKPDAIRTRLEAFQPYYDWQVNRQDNNPIDPGAQRAWRIFTGLIQPNSQDCASQPPFSADDYFGALFCYFDERVAQYIPAYGAKDHVAEVFAINSTDANLGQQFGLGGYADDNWINGRQTYVFEFSSPFYRSAGFGLSFITTHEIGHHIGLSHPHDGYDSTNGVNYGPAGPFYYAWAGSESNSAMSYLRVSTGFGRFNEDNMYRWETAGYLNASNELLAEILADPDAGTAAALLQEADHHAALALSSFSAWSYLESAMHARMAYETILKAAAQVGVPLADQLQLRLGPSDAGLPLKQENWRLDER